MAVEAAEFDLGSAGRVLAAFREVGGALAEERDLDTVFHIIVRNLCELTGLRRASMHLLNPETGLLHGQVGHASREIDAEVKGLVSGMPGDGFTREILDTKRPVLLTNTFEDPRAVHAAMRRWKARSVLGVPMILREEVIGTLCLDNEDDPHDFTPEEQSLAIGFAELAATAVMQVQLTTRLRSSLQTVNNQVRLLQQAGQMEAQLSEIILQGRGLREVCDLLARLLGKPCAVYDADFRRVMHSQDVPGTRHPVRVIDDAAQVQKIHPLVTEVEPGRPAVIGPFPWLGVKHRLLVSVLLIDGESAGYLIVGEAHGKFGVLDEALTRRASANIALERARERRSAEVDWHVIEAFTGSVLRGEHPDPQERADVLGISLDTARVVCLVASTDPALPLPVAAQAMARMMTAENSPSAVLATKFGSDIALILELPDDSDTAAGVAEVKDRLRDAIDDVAPAGTLCAALSGVIRATDEDPSALAEAQQVIGCMRKFLAVDGDHVLAVDDLGAGRLLLATADQVAAQHFARTSLGPLYTDDSHKTHELLLTLNAFLQAGRSVRRAAAALSVHPNTVRYRVNSIERLTGLAVATDDGAYLSAQMALLVLRLSGRLPLTPVVGAEAVAVEDPDDDLDDDAPAGP